LKHLGLAVPPLLGLFLVSASCADLLGVRDLPARSPGYSACAGTIFPDPSCAACVDASCCDAATACAADATCAADLACRSRCGASDAACRIACAASHPSTGALAGDLERCLRTQCMPACVTCGVYGDAVSAACSACMERNACEAVHTCTGSAECDRSAECMLMCPDPSCIFKCRTTSPPAYNALSFLADVIPTCPACNLGTSWNCVDKYIIPPPGTPDGTYTVELTDRQRQPLDGVIVRACLDLACNDDPLLVGPVPNATTDAAGLAKLRLGFDPDPASGVVGFNGFLDIFDPKGRAFPGIHMISNLFRDQTDLLQLVGMKDLQILPLPDPSKIAGAIMVAGDCTTSFARGVTFTLAPPFDLAKVRYLDDLLNGTSTGGTGTAFALLEEPLPATRLDFTYQLAGTTKTLGRGWMWLRLGTASVVLAEPDSAN
jgi:hypothetical protein